VPMTMRSNRLTPRPSVSDPTGCRSRRGMSAAGAFAARLQRFIDERSSSPGFASPRGDRAAPPPRRR
jgi:hypothetical protein